MIIDPSSSTAGSPHSEIPARSGEQEVPIGPHDEGVVPLELGQSIRIRIRIPVIDGDRALREGCGSVLDKMGLLDIADNESMQRHEFLEPEQEEPRFRDTTYGLLRGSRQLVASWERWWSTHFAARMRGLLSRGWVQTRKD